jgi:hypothetical protein
MKDHRYHSPLLLAIAAFAAIFSLTAPAQQPAPIVSVGCGVLDGVTRCNWPAFRVVLASAHTIAVDHNQMDRFTGRQLSELVSRVGKNLAGPNNPGDLTFVIVPSGNHGIDIGPAEKDVLQFEVHSGPASDGRLLWLETLHGDPERPWAANVHSVIEQFEARLARP